MAEIPFKARTEKHYKLEGAWWTIPDIDKVVTFENLDTGGYVYGVVLNRVDGNEWRVIEERRARSLKPVEVTIEPEYVELAIQCERKLDEAPLRCDELLDMVLNESDYVGGDQIECSQGLVDGEKVTYFLNVSKGYTPIKAILSHIASAIAKLGFVVRYTRTPEGMESLI